MEKEPPTGICPYTAETDAKDVQGIYLMNLFGSLLGCKDSLFHLGVMTFCGQGTPPNRFLAFQLIRQAAGLLHTEALYILGLLYLNGLGTEKNFRSAGICFRRAAENGHLKAQKQINAILYNGQGGRQDPEEAAYWRSLAAKQTPDPEKSSALRDSGADNTLNDISSSQLNEGHRPAPVRLWAQIGRPGRKDDRPPAA
ncbi:MAG: sel1 repeat family protein [Deltaproteobacteria bacterium]|jgi:TPR repeat protein|nr:sel1 repeat family protein [Deltaproteobacteria bacterium]